MDEIGEIMVKEMRKWGIIEREIGDDGIGGKMREKKINKIENMKLERNERRIDIVEIVGIGDVGKWIKERIGKRRKIWRRRKEGRNKGIDRKIGMIEKEKLIRERMDMEKIMMRKRNGEELIEMCSNLKKEREKKEKKVGIIKKMEKNGNDRGKNLERIKGMSIVENIMKEEGWGKRKRNILGKMEKVEKGIMCKEKEEEDNKRKIWILDKRKNWMKMLEKRMNGKMIIGRRIDERRIGSKNVLRKGEKKRKGKKVKREMEWMDKKLGNERGIVNMKEKFGNMEENEEIIDLMKWIKIEMIDWEMKDEEKNGSRIMKRSVKENRWIGGEGEESEEENEGIKSKFEIGIWNIGWKEIMKEENKVDGVDWIVKGVERREIDLEGKEEEKVREMDEKRIKKNME